MDPFLGLVSYLLQTTCSIYFQVKILRKLQQVSHLFCIDSILQNKLNMFSDEYTSEVKNPSKQCLLRTQKT